MLQVQHCKGNVLQMQHCSLSSLTFNDGWALLQPFSNFEPGKAGKIDLPIYLGGFP
jgi:hypothetical protein